MSRRKVVYVFSKRVVKPHMQRICDLLNEKFVPRYGDDLYISFIDPVPEDRGARTTEMQAAVASQPILTINEAREEFLGLGPVEDGDVLMAPSTMAPVGEPQGDGDVTPEASDGADAGKMLHKAIEAKVQKAANGQRVPDDSYLLWAACPLLHSKIRCSDWSEHEYRAMVQIKASNASH